VANEKAWHALNMAQFFFFWALGKALRKVFLLTAIWSYQIPIKFFKMFSIAPHFYPICFPKNCPHFTCITRPSIFNRDFYIREFAKLQFFHFIFFGWANQNGFLQKKKNCWTWEALHLSTLKIWGQYENRGQMSFRVCLHVIHSPTINHIQFGEMMTKRFIRSSHYFSMHFLKTHT